MKVKERNTVRINFLVSPVLMADLKAAAAAREITISKLCRGALDQFRDEPPPPPPGFPPNIWRLKR